MMTSYSFRKAGVAVVACALLFASIAIARNSMRASDPDLVRQYPTAIQSHHSSLDEDYTELRYMKTTDYGVTWSGPTQAGTVSTVNQTISRIPDFNAVTLANNELAYACYFEYAATPGIYAIVGPAFTPVLAIPEGANNFGTSGGDAGNNGTGWAQIGKTPNGDLWIITYGEDASGNRTLWAAHSTNNGAVWSTPWVVAAAPGTLPATAQLFHIAPVNDATYCFVLFQDENWRQYVLRFATTNGATGTYVDLGADAGSAVSYYIGACRPIEYDPAAHALFVCWRNADLSGTAVYYSSNYAVSFQSMVVPGAQRYPSLALRTADNTPFVISNVGVPAAGARHWSWFSYDEFGYGGGSWRAIDTIAAITSQGSAGPLLYINQAYFWDADHAVASHNLWGAFTPEGLYTSRSTNGGTSWGEFTQRWQYETNQFDAGSMQNQQLVGGLNGTAYVVWCARTGVTDVTGPSFSNVQLLTAPTTLGPYNLSVEITDNNVDSTDNHITFYIPSACGTDSDTLSADSYTITDHATHSGTYFFHIPTTICGHTIAQGDSVFYYFWGRELIGNSGESSEQIIRAGIEWLGVGEPAQVAVKSFALNGNYPNPFNPTTLISFDLPGSYRTTLKVFNTLGQEVAELARGEMLSQGHHELAFNGTDLPTGVYFYTLTAGPYSATQKMVLLK